MFSESLLNMHELYNSRLAWSSNPPIVAAAVAAGGVFTLIS
jgi:hypothetical protein